MFRFMIYDFLILDSGRTGLARQLPPLTPPCTGGGWHRGVFGWPSLGLWEGGGGAALLHRGAFSR